MKGILDPIGEELNPITGKEYSEQYKILGKKWSKLPAYKERERLINDISNNQVLLIESSTGSGKTVLIPKFALHVLDYKGKIGITLPKQMIAKSSAEFAAKTLDVTLGKEVGYQYRGSPKEMKNESNLLLYATDGSIVQQLLRDPELSNYSCIIIDEAHERKIQIDFLLFLLRETLRLRTDFKLIIMSATIDKEIFENYFKDFKFKSALLKGERLFPIDSIYLNRSLSYDKVLDKGFEILINILETEEYGDILFFVTSISETRLICQKLNKYQKVNISEKGEVFCVELYSGVDDNKQKLAQDKLLYQEHDPETKYTRKVVISTNVAESSLTVDGIKYVIDTGYEVYSSYDPVNRAKVLSRKLITKSQAKQRMGRSGRTEPGVCYHVYTEKDYEEMEDYPQPDIRVSDISDECLSLLRLEKIGNLEKLLDTLTRLIEPPKEVFITDAFNKLMELGLVENNKISVLGKAVNMLSNDLHMGVSLVYGKSLNCGYELCNIFGMIEACKGNINSFFIKRDKMDDKNINILKKKFSHKSGDHLSLLKMFEKYEKFKGNKLINHKLMKKSKFLARRLKDNLRKTDKMIDFSGDNIIRESLDKRILFALKIGYSTNMGYKSGNQYRTNTLEAKMDRDTFLEKKPKKVFFSELMISMGQPKIKIVSKQ